MIRIPKMLLIGSTAKDAGKTTYIIKLIQKFVKENPHIPLYGIKSTVLRDKSSTSGYVISEELNPERAKDTSKMLAAGCKQVLWLRCDEDHAEQGFKELIEKIPADSFIICESNTIRNFVEPDFFLMIVKKEEVEWKKTALAIKEKVDLFIESKMISNEIVYKPDVTISSINNELNWIISHE